jgi:hypothetical protein
MTRSKTEMRPVLDGQRLIHILEKIIGFVLLIVLIRKFVKIKKLA